jgi:hypothetical protein
VSYTILRTNGSLLTSIPDGTVNTTSTPLSLPGRNFASYGQIVDTNFVHQLENFADSTPPNNAIRGQLWYNTTANVLYICPTDGESNVALWVPILTPNNISNISVDNLVANANITANNATITNNANANAISTNYLTVNVQANIANANITGNAVISNLQTVNVTTGSTSIPGTLTGAWTVNGDATINSVANTALYVAGGNLVLDSGIKTDEYYYSNGAPVSFDGTYSNSNVALYLPTYTGTVGTGDILNIFNGRTLTTGSNVTTGTITGNWTLSAGSKINGLSDIDGANVDGEVAFAAVANSVAGANVSGQVAFAATANSVAGSNVSGQVAFAAVANSVAGANVTGTVANATFATSAGSATTAGTVTTNAQPNITSTGTLTGLSVSGGTTLSSTLTVSGNAQFTGQVVNLGSNANVRISGGASGQVLSTNGSGGLSWVSAAAADTAITVTANAQPNITSTGTLTGLSVSGNASFTGANVSLGDVGNVRIAGGSAGDILTSAGFGALAWQAPATEVIPSGTRMLFVQTSAPSGWVKDTSNDNAALRVVSGSAGTGGSVNFTAAFTSQSVSGTVGSTTADGTIGSTSINANIANTAVSGNIGSTTAGGSINNTSITAGIGETAVSGVIGTTSAGGTVGTTSISATIGGTSVTGTIGQTAVSGTTNSSLTGISIFPSTTRVENEQLEVTVLTSAFPSDPGHTHSFTSSTHDHTFSSPSHTHDFNQTAHGHTFAGASHTHSFSSPNHTHTFSQTAHNHSFSGTPHDHTFSSPNHTHTFNQTAHSHTFAGTAHNHTFSGTAINLAVKYVDTIIATKS